MPVLICNDDPNRIFEWDDNTFVGRGLVRGLSFDRATKADREVSSMHAALTWNRKAASWQIHDLGSVNGTTVSGQGVHPGTPCLIKNGDIVLFGTTAWTVRACAAPAAAAVSRRNGQIRTAVDDLLLLPDDRAPTKVITRAAVTEGGAGPTAGWVMYDWHEGWSDGEAGVPVEHGLEVQVDGRHWLLTLPDPVAGYATMPAVGRITEQALVLHVPANLENIRATLVRGSHRIPLAARRHHELWWLLAQARIADADRGRPDGGWVTTEDIDRQLGAAGPGYLGVLVHRSRKQVERAGFADYADIIERADGRIRLGLSRVEIHEGG